MPFFPTKLSPTMFFKIFIFSELEPVKFKSGCSFKIASSEIPLSFIS